MDTNRLTTAADHHTNVTHADGSNGARTTGVLHAIAQTSLALIAATYGLSEHHLGVNHV